MYKREIGTVQYIHTMYKMTRGTTCRIVHFYFSVQSGVFPASNMVSPVAEQLRNTLSPVSWAKAGLGLPSVSLS